VSSALDSRGRPYEVLAPLPPSPYGTHEYAAVHAGYPRRPVGDQVAYQLGPPAGAVPPPGAPAAGGAGGGGDRYSWKIAGFSECSQSCGGGQSLLHRAPLPPKKRPPFYFFRITRSKVNRF